MYAYAMASAHLELPHVLLERQMVGCMVGWPARAFKQLNITGVR
jgi:hypothetical protein